MFKMWICVVTIAFATCLYTVPCDPNKACLCTVKSDKYNTTKMDCSNKGFHISDICKSVGITINMTVRELDVTGKNIVVIRNSSEMIGCECLEWLNLQNNSLKWIGKDALKGLTELKVLNLSMNKLEVYKDDGLYNLTTLETLETLRLNGNVDPMEHFVNLSYPAITMFPKLKTLYLDGLTNTAIDRSYSNVTSLTLSGYIATCHLGNLTLVTFQHLNSIRYLNVSNCDIKIVEAETFKGLKFLEKLDLSFNQRLGFRSLRNVSYGLQFTNIKFLNYSNVYNTFGLGNVVRKKDLCYLRNTSLTELVLDGNRIKLFETNSPMLLPEMFEILHLNDNTFTFAPYLLQVSCVQHLKQLYGSYQNTFHNPNSYSIEDNTNIAEPEIDNDGDHDDCPYMKDEYLQNISSHIPNCIFYETDNINVSIPSLPAQTTKVVLRGSSMQYSLPSVLIFPFNNSVEYIDVSGNIFYSLVGPIGPFPKLKYLDLSRNYCSYISRKFFSLFSDLENLQISQNFIGLILSSHSGIFDTLSSLRILNLTSNRITTIPQNTFTKLLNLETLDLSANSIESLSIKVEALVNLTHIDLSYNSLATMPMSLAEHLARVSKRTNVPFTINMRYNSIKVSCQYERFLKWMIDHPSNFVDFESYLFVDDNNGVIQPSQIQQHVENLSKSCRSYTLLIVICSIGLSVFLAVVIGGVIYKNRWKLRYMLYMAKGRYNGYMAIPTGEPQLNYRYDAFISYSAEDIRFILDWIIPTLEEHNFKLCIHQRDFMPGNSIADNIIDAIMKSKTTVVILTEKYLRSKWCMYEFNMARKESMYTRNNERSLVFVMLENVPTKHMPLEMIQWIKEIHIWNIIKMIENVNYCVVTT